MCGSWECGWVDSSGDLRGAVDVDQLTHMPTHNALLPG